MGVPTRIVRLTTLGRLRARRGDPGAAEALSEAWTLAERTGDLQRLWPAAAGRAELAWLSGRPDAEVSGLVASTYELAVRLGHPWAIGELGQWLRAGEPVPHRAVAAGSNAAALAAAASAAAASAAPGRPRRCWPGRRRPRRTGCRRNVAALAWERFGCPYEAASALALAGELATGGHAAGHHGARGRPVTGAGRAWPGRCSRRCAGSSGSAPGRPPNRVAARLRSLGVRPPRRATLAHPVRPHRTRDRGARPDQGRATATRRSRRGCPSRRRPWITTCPPSSASSVPAPGARRPARGAQHEAAQIEAEQRMPAWGGRGAKIGNRSRCRRASLARIVAAQC